MKIIDLRSDTVTKPSQKMRQIMAEAEVGDDVYGEDPTVNRLETIGAEVFNKEAALFTSSGTQSNLLALISQCQRGDEYIAGQFAHSYKYEGGGAAVLGSLQPQPIPFNRDGTVDLDMAATFVKDASDIHYAKTRLFCLENTFGGKAIPMDFLPKAKAFADQYDLGLHLDGARVFNAAIKHQIPVSEIAAYFDTVSMCLSKGLGTPIGSLLIGSKEIIDKARRWRKMLGGGMRQAGIIAAAGILALEENVQRLVEDHQKAAILAKGLQKIERVEVEDMEHQTNMCFIKLTDTDVEKLPVFLKEKGILIESYQQTRLVLHLDISFEDVDFVINAFNLYFNS